MKFIDQFVFQHKNKIHATKLKAKMAKLAGKSDRNVVVGLKV